MTCDYEKDAIGGELVMVFKKLKMDASDDFEMGRQEIVELIREALSVIQSLSRHPSSVRADIK